MGEITDLRIKTKPRTTCEEFELIQIENYGNNRSNAHRIEECDCFLPRRFYQHVTPRVADTFEDMGMKFGFGFIIKENKEQVIKTLKNINWKHYEFGAMGERKSNRSITGFAAYDVIRAYEENK